ncbi:Translation machinery-associated protein 22 [Quaeritorhiza haematococci]|nr:Translation machinery-associated protein 22 [Quaeritorhiza haematococci]
MPKELSESLENASIEDADVEKKGAGHQTRGGKGMPRDESAKADKDKKKKATSKVIIKRVERTKRKCTISVQGLESFDVDLKKAAKLFATRFACGSSVTKNPQGQDEIVVQGDVQDDIYDLIRDTYPQVPEEQIELKAK